MFWRFGGYANVSSIDTILDKPDVTTEELLDESDLIQELKQQNSKLIDFLRDERVLKKLLHYVVADELPEDASPDSEQKAESQSPRSDEREERQAYSFFGGKGKARERSKSLSKKAADGETEHEKKEAQRKKYAYVACEVLSSDVWSITEALLEQPEQLRVFWQYMHTPAPLDALQAGYFTKVNEALLDKKTEAMLNCFKSLDGIVPAMLQHVDCPMVMDLLLKIISLEKHDGGAGIVDWLQVHDLIPLLLAYLSPDSNSATQTSAGDFLKAIITISANATTQDQSVIGPNELTRQLVSEPCIKSLITDMLRGGNPLTVGVGIIIEVIRKNNSDYDLDSQIGPEPKTSDPIYLGNLLRQFATHIPDFMQLIRSPSAKKPDLKAAFGGKVEPLGFDRFKTCELMAELLHCSNMGLLNERGAEEDMRRRDAERERLKADGKLAGTPKAPSSPSEKNQSEEFGSSVDSQGFHHAERPSESEDDMDESEKPEEIRRLEVQNASDDDGGFEEVNKPNADDFPDEVSFDEDEKVGYDELLPAEERSEKQEERKLSLQEKFNEAVPKSLSLSQQQTSPIKQSFLHFDPPPTHAIDSPTTAGVTDRIDKLDVDEDTVMTEFGEEASSTDSDEDGPSELEKEAARGHPEDKPAPLFARKTETPASSSSSSSQEAGETPGPEQEEKDVEIGESVATIQDEQPNGERAEYETERDGSPVVGDLLKIKFVEHRVVPTILDFFFRFPWNNFLHNVVYDVVQQVFNGTLDRGYNRTLAFALFNQVGGSDSCKAGEQLGLVSSKDITDRILDGQRASDVSQADRGMRLGYMGHLTLIAEEVCKFGNREGLDSIVTDRLAREEWISYVEGTLAETRDKDNAVLGGVRPQDSMGVRPMGMGGLGGGFTSNTASTLASAGIGAGIMGQGSMGAPESSTAFEINSGISAFGDGGDDDEDMEQDGRRGGLSRLEDDEQVGELSFEDVEMDYQ